jgi:hypothetical protein
MFPGFSKLTVSNMKSLNTQEAIQSMKLEVHEWLEHLEHMSELTEQFEIPEVQEDMREWGENPLGMGDIGVEAWKDKSKEWLRQSLGMSASSGLYGP